MRSGGVIWHTQGSGKSLTMVLLDDGFFELSEQGKIQLDWAALDEIAGEALRVARSRLE